MEDDYADGKMDAETFTKMRIRYRGELQKLDEELQQCIGKENAFARYLKEGIRALEHLPQLYQNGSLKIKRDVFGSIFSEKVFFDQKKCRTTRVNEAVRLILATSKGLDQQKTVQPFKNLELSGEVEVTGIEPSF